MQPNFNDLTVLFPAVFNLEEIKQSTALQPFSSEAVSFLNALSKELTKSPKVREYPDVATFAFFCRSANILKLKDEYSNEKSLRFGRGIIFHIAPSNVPVNFAYSLLCGILAGNVNIVRVPSRDYEQVSIICNAISKLGLYENFNTITSRIVLIRYEKQSNMTALFSSICDVRIIWGGDETIAQIRKYILPSRSFDVTFADRYSLCVINADKYISENKPEKIAFGFYNDTYLYDQNACTAPHLVVWTGSEENIKKSKILFWESLYNIVKQKQYLIQPVIAIDKLTSFYNQTIKMSGLRRENNSDNLIMRVKLESLNPQIDEFRCNSGYFCEYNAQSIFEIKNIVNRKYQTLAYYGFDKQELNNFMRLSQLNGIDRIVPIGQTTNFSVIWDGFDLVKTLSRICEII